MTHQYLLQCPSCEHEITVGPSQAGNQVICLCGQRVEVPTLRALQQLPEAMQAKDSSEPAWGFRHGLIALAMILAIFCLIPGIYWRVAQLTMPHYSLEAQMHQVMERLDQASPRQTWEYWHNAIVPLSEDGLTELATYDSIAHERNMKALTRYQTIAFGAAGFFTLLAITVALWRKS